MTVLGAGLLWFGWFGFNAGSAVAADGIAANAVLATNTAVAAATITWVLASYIHRRKVSVVGAACGAVAGLVAITPASGYVEPLAAIAIGLAAGVVCFLAVELKPRLGYDDSLDAVGVHLVGGLVGALLTGVFASLAINPAGADGSLAQVGRQAAASGITLVFAFVATLVICKVVDRTVGFRIAEDDEETGVDLVEHGEIAYAFRERDRHAGRAASDLSDAELAVLREQLVLEATARVLDSIKASDLEPVEAPAAEEP
jgi:Amt family ammonium transporter